MKDILVETSFWLLKINLLNICVHVFICTCFCTVLEYSTISQPGSYGRGMFSFLVDHFTFSHAMYKLSRFSTSSPPSGVSISFFRYADKCVGISHCGFNLHFTNAWWCQIFFHVLIYPVRILIHEMSQFWNYIIRICYYWIVRVLHIFKTQIFCYICGLKYFLPVSSLLVQPLTGLL